MTEPNTEPAYNEKEFAMPGTFQPDLVDDVIPTDKIPVVLVLGLTGAGKTTFINHVAGTSHPVGAGLSACTTATTCAAADIAGVPVILVDTPGFDDPKNSDPRILANITTWMEHKLGANIKVAAAVYLHNITNERMYGSSVQNLILFRELMGHKYMKNVGLVTTKWDKIDQELGVAREKELCEDSAWWKMMLRSGARKYRTDNTRDSCISIVRQLLESSTPEFMEIQREMGVQKKKLSSTKAGEHVYLELLRRIKAEESHLKQLEEMLKSNAWEGVDGMKAELEDQIRMSRTKLKSFQGDKTMIERAPTWGEWSWDIGKREGPRIAGQVLFNHFLGGSGKASIDHAAIIEQVTKNLRAEQVAAAASAAAAGSGAAEAGGFLAAAGLGAAAGGPVGAVFGMGCYLFGAALASK